MKFFSIRVKAAATYAAKQTYHQMGDRLIPIMFAATLFVTPLTYEHLAAIAACVWAVWFAVAALSFGAWYDHYNNQMGH